MEQNNSEISLRTAVLVLVGVIVIVSAVGIFLGNAVFWKPVDSRSFAEVRFNDIEKAYRANPKSRNAAIAYALSLAEKGDKKSPEKIYQDLVKQYPKDNAVLFNYASYKEQVGDIESAKEMYAKVLKTSPYFIQANVHYGILLRNDKKYDEAVKKFDNALLISPGAADILVERAKTYIAMENNEKASEDLNRALSFVPNYEEAKTLLEGLKAK